MDDVDINDERAQLELMKQQKDCLLKEWDISFIINGEVLVNVLNFMYEVNHEIHIKFYADKALLLQKSSDNIQFATVEIHYGEFVEYIPNLKEEFKGILIDMNGTIEELISYASKDDAIEIRIDTVNSQMIEFHCFANLVIWTFLKDPEEVIRNTSRTLELIEKARNNPDIGKASIHIEPSTLVRICALKGHKSRHDKTKINDQMLIEVGDIDGLNISYGTIDKGKILNVKPAFLPLQGNESKEDYGDGNLEEIDVGNLEEIDVGNLEEDHIDYIEDSKPKAKPSEMVYKIVADSPQNVVVERNFLTPFLKLKGLRTINIEIRTNKPIVIIQEPFNKVYAMLTVAPRIENEEIK